MLPLDQSWTQNSEIVRPSWYKLEEWAVANLSNNLHHLPT